MKVNRILKKVKTNPKLLLKKEIRLLKLNNRPSLLKTNGLVPNM